MRLSVVDRKSAAVAPEARIVFVREGDRASVNAALSALTKAGLDVESLFAAAGFKGEADRVWSHLPLAKKLPKRIVFCGVGKAEALTEETFRRAGAFAARAIGDAAEVEVAADERDDARRMTEAFATGFHLARYRFDRYLSAAKKDKKPEPALVFVATDATAKTGAAEAAIVADALIDAVALARDLGNLPGNLGTPLVLADAAKRMAKKEGLRCKIHDENDIGRLGMGSFLSVSLGSVVPPRLIELEYGKKTKGLPTIALVGKGLTFDSGGISIKPAADMDKMRHDKCGGAAVIGAMLAIARLGIKAHVVGIVPSSENMPGKNANKPGDVVTAMNGKTIEILNTDAEGRLILADALSYCEKFKPVAIIDAATLTGLCHYTFGDKACAILGTDQKLIDVIREAGEKTGERCWQLPLWDDYADAIKGNHSDINNTGDGYAGTITATMFLKEFVPAKVPWIHLDIAGTAYTAKNRYDCPKGATGFGVRLFAELLSNWNRENYLSV